MSESESIRTRAATSDDAAPLRAAFGDRPAFRRLLDRDNSLLVILVEDDGALAGAMAVERAGHAIHDGWAWVSDMALADRVGEAAPAALIEGAIAALSGGDRPPAALAAPTEVGDRAAARRLEAAGFRPRGGPYRVIGPGMVEHLHGYTDPVGYLVDFVRELSQAPGRG